MELIYTIDKARSEQDGSLVIKIQEAKRSAFSLSPIEEGVVLTQERLLALAGPKETNLLPFLFNEESLYLKKTSGRSIDRRHTRLDFIHISYRSIPEALKLFATTGKLYYQNRSLVVDLYGKADFYYVGEASGARGYVKTGSQEFEVATCDFVGRGPPHFFVKGVSLKRITTAVPWKDLKAAFEGRARPLKELMEEAQEDAEAPRVIVKDLPASIDPLPILVLKDRLGAFADLEMDYGEQGKFSFHDDAVLDRQLSEEQAWEKDLLETEYIRKAVGTSRYYCPVDKVAKSLAFLLEIGWQVRDWRGNRVLLQTGTDISAADDRNHIAVRGKISYTDFQADLTDIVGAFNRRERFATIAPGHAALLPDSFEGLDCLAAEGEVVGDSVRVRKNQFGAIASLFESQPNIRVDDATASLKGHLEGFQGIQSVVPGGSFTGALRPYQQQGLDWLCFLRDFHFHGILADDMGLGKTVQVLAFLSRRPLQAPVLIIVPTSLLFNWKREIEHFLPSCAYVEHHGGQRSISAAELDKPQVILITYTTLRLDFELLSQLSYDCLILDEAQAIKNAHTQTFQAVSRLNASFRLSLTGTPIENNLMELWSHFHFLMPDLFGDEKAFEAEVRAGASDPRFLQRIKRKIRPFLLRRKKSEVAKDLPEKIEQTVWVDMGTEQRSVYETFLAGTRKNLIKKVAVDGIAKHRMEVLEAIMRLRQICCHPFLVGEEVSESAKLEVLVQDLETIVSEGRKVLVYSQFTSMLALIGKRIKERGWKFAYLDGSTENREKVVREFQENDEVPLFLISLKAGGVGLNLTAADYVFLYDPWWNQAVENQAIDRAHRIGRKDVVVAKRYIVAESIEEKIVKLKQSKSDLAQSLIDEGAAFSTLNAEDLSFLLE